MSKVTVSEETINLHDINKTFSVIRFRKRRGHAMEEPFMGCIDSIAQKYYQENLNQTI